MKPVRRANTDAHASLALVLTLVLSLAACGDRARTEFMADEPGSGTETPSEAAEPTVGEVPTGIRMGAAATAQLGGTVYATVCVECHSGRSEERAPGYTSLSGMSPRAVFTALDQGRMRVHGQDLTAEEKRAVAEFLTGAPLAETPMPEAAFCEASGETAPGTVYWSGHGGDLEATGFRTAAQAGLTADDVPNLTLKWAFGIPDGVQTRSKPAVVGDRVIVGSQYGEVYSLDLETGCIQWTFAAEAAIRGAVVIGEGPGGMQTAFFVDFRTGTYALDAATGKLLWTTRVGEHQDASNTGSPALHDGKVFVPVSSMEVVTAQDPEYPCCTSSGEVVAVDAMTGEVIWRHRVVPDEAVEVGANELGTPVFAPSGAPVWSSPTVDAQRGLVYVGTGENYTRPASATSDAILALDIDTGQLAWSMQGTADDAYNLACVAEENTQNCPTPMGPDVDFGMAPMLSTRPDGKEILVVGQKSGVVWALDPDANGEVLWATRVGKGSALGGIHWGMATDGSLAYATNNDHPGGFLGIEDPDLEPTPGVYALDLGSGEVMWSAPADPAVCGDREGCFAANSAAPTAIPGAVFAGSLDGHIRAYSTDDGSVIWEFDTAREIETVNGIPGKGGALDGPGPVVARGMLLVNSGYSLFNEMPGNVLLAFGVEE